MDKEPRTVKEIEVKLKELRDFYDEECNRLHDDRGSFDYYTQQNYNRSCQGSINGTSEYIKKLEEKLEKAKLEEFDNRAW